jgi:hypothetical protein
MLRYERDRYGIDTDLQNRGLGVRVPPLLPASSITWETSALNKSGAVVARLFIRHSPDDLGRTGVSALLSSAK